MDAVLITSEPVYSGLFDTWLKDIVGKPLPTPFKQEKKINVSISGFLISKRVGEFKP